MRTLMILTCELHNHVHLALLIHKHRMCMIITLARTSRKKLLTHVCDDSVRFQRQQVGAKSLQISENSGSMAIGLS